MGSIPGNTVIILHINWLAGFQKYQLIPGAERHRAAGIVYGARIYEVHIEKCHVNTAYIYMCARVDQLLMLGLVVQLLHALTRKFLEWVHKTLLTTGLMTIPATVNLWEFGPHECPSKGKSKPRVCAPLPFELSREFSHLPKSWGKFETKA